MPEQMYWLKVLQPSLAVMLADGAREIQSRPVSLDVETFPRKAQRTDDAGPPFAIVIHISHPAVIVLEELNS